MNKILARGIFVLLVLIIGSAAAFAQDTIDPDAQPNFGNVDLSAGFQPDPYIVTAVSGGPLDASTLKLSADCVGFISSSPDFNIERTGSSGLLRIFFAGMRDTTLVVRDPAGRYTCGDDFDATDPLVEFTNPAEGTYNIWIGSFASGDFVPGYLMFSELQSSPGAVISTILHVTGSTAGTSTQGIEGVEYFPDLSNLHVDGKVDYPQTPPVGGEHSPTWLTCGIYTLPVPNENAVHSLEHGVVWITYQPGLSEDEITTLSNIALQSDHRILSPYPGIPSPIVVSAWGYQLQLQSADDPRLMEFINTYENGPTAPEPGAAC